MAVVVDYLVLPGAFALGYITRYPDCQLLHEHRRWPWRTTPHASLLLFVVVAVYQLASTLCQPCELLPPQQTFTMFTNRVLLVSDEMAREATQACVQFCAILARSFILLGRSTIEYNCGFRIITLIYNALGSACAGPKVKNTQTPTTLQYHKKTSRYTIEGIRSQVRV